MRIPHIVLHFGEIRCMANILQFRHVVLCVGVVLLYVHWTVSSISLLTWPTCCSRRHHCWTARAIEMILQLLISGLLVNVWSSSTCFDLIWRVLVVHFLKRIFVKVNGCSVTLRRNLRIRQLSLLLKIVQHSRHFLRRQHLINTLWLSHLDFIKHSILVARRIIFPISWSVSVHQLSVLWLTDLVTLLRLIAQSWSCCRVLWVGVCEHGLVYNLARSSRAFDYASKLCWVDAIYLVISTLI